MVPTVGSWVLAALPCFDRTAPGNGPRVCNGGELVAELLAPDSRARRVVRWAYSLALLAIFALGLYLAIDTGSLG
jgi:hypothetical protein